MSRPERPRHSRPRRPVGVRRPVAAAASLLLLLPVAACGDDTASADGSTAETQDTTLTLLAAASLTEVYADLASTFEAEHPGVEVETSLGSSTDLAEQAADGAPGDVLSTADETAMGIAQDAGVVADPEVFATNAITLAVPADNPADITSLDDLAGTSWVRCADQVPCGRVGMAVLEANQVTAEPVSLEEDVKAALEKVTTGEADAALVYATDAVAAGDAVQTVEVPGAEEEATSYFLGTLEAAEQPDLAADWRELVLSGQGQSALADAGFSGP